MEGISFEIPIEIKINILEKKILVNYAKLCFVYLFSLKIYLFQAKIQ